jgi:hypothetical protein
MGDSSGRGRSWRVRLAIAGAIVLAAAGAVAGVVLGSGHGVAPAGVGAGIAAATALVASFWWDHAREQRGGGPGAASDAGSSIKVRQRVGRLGPSARMLGARSKSSRADVDVRQDIDIAGSGSTIVGFDGDPGQPL